jgi:hypothetical protein
LLGSVQRIWRAHLQSHRPRTFKRSPDRLATNLEKELIENAYFVVLLLSHPHAPKPPPVRLLPPVIYLLPPVIRLLPKSE